MKKQREIDILNGRLLPSFISFVIPVMLSGMLQLLFNAADVVVVGQYVGKEALAAVSSTGALVNLVINLFIGLAIGAGITIAQKYGAGDIIAVRRVLHTSMLISVLGGIVLAVFGFFSAAELLKFTESPDDVIPLATIYMQIFFLGTPALMVYNFGSTIMRTSGDTRRPLYILSVSGVINVGLNIFFVVKCEMGVVGVALATVISQTFSAALVVACMMHNDTVFKLCLAELKIDMESLKDVLRYGLPSGLQSCVFSLSNVVVQSTVNTFGSTVIAGNGAAANVEGFLYAAMNSVYQGALTFTGQSYGAKQYKRIDKIWGMSILIVTVMGVILSGSALIFRNSLISIYSPQPDIIAMGVVRAIPILSAYCLCGIMDVTCGMLRGVGRSTVSAIVSMVGACGLRLLWIALIMPLVSRDNGITHALTMLYLSYPISWGVTALAQTGCFLFVRHKYLKNAAEQADE